MRFTKVRLTCLGCRVPLAEKETTVCQHCSSKVYVQPFHKRPSVPTDSTRFICRASSGACTHVLMCPIKMVTCCIGAQVPFNTFENGRN